MGSWLVVCACITLAAARGPEQVHISFGYQPSQMIVMWSTKEYGDSVVMYGQDQFHLSGRQSGSCWRFTNGNPRGLQYMHRVLLEVRTAVFLVKRWRADLYFCEFNYGISNFRDCSPARTTGTM